MSFKDTTYMSNDLEQIKNIYKRIKEIAAKYNLEVANFAVIPGAEETDPSFVSASFMLTAESVETLEETEQRKTNDEFDALLADAFEDSSDFADDETKALLDKVKQRELEAKEELRKLIEGE